MNLDNFDEWIIRIFFITGILMFSLLTFMLIIYLWF